MSTWKPDPWHEEGIGEKFYQDAFKGGVCKYCGAPDKSGPLALCECSGLRAARHTLKMALYGKPEQGKPAYNPDKHIEPKQGPELPL